MEQYFTNGSRIPLQNGQSAEVIAKLGEGGQGTVYRVYRRKRICAEMVS